MKNYLVTSLFFIFLFFISYHLYASSCNGSCEKPVATVCANGNDNGSVYSYGNYCAAGSSKCIANPCPPTPPQQ